MPETTQQCYISHAATLQGDDATAGHCGLIFYNTDIGKIKNMTVTSKFGSTSAKIDQEFRILMRSIKMSSHAMASEYLLDPIKVN